MLTSAEAARIFHDWAFKEGLLTDPAAKPSSSQVQQGAIDPITDAGIHLLRSKQIQSIGFNQAKEEVQVFLKRAAPSSRKQLKVLPSKVDNVQIVYRQGVQNTIGNAPSVPFGQPPFTIRQSSAGRHLTCGSSISVGNIREAGTLGCLVRDTNGDMFGLSNNHVTGSCSFAQINLPIVAPGVFDVAPGGLNPFTLGFHSRALKLVAGAPGNVNHKDNLDAAVFKISKEADVSSYQGNAYDTPTQSAALVGGMEVEKVGRTTGHTKGKVVSQIFGAHGINYNVPIYGFAGTVFYEPVFAVAGIADAFSTNGDSGSLVTAVDQNGVRSAVGLIVGGMNDGSSPGKVTCIILPIEPILKMLAVTLVSGHNI